MEQRILDAIFFLIKSIFFTTMSDIEKGKQAAAVAAVDKEISGATQNIGIGSGSTVMYVVQRLAERVRAEHLSVRCVPTSFQTEQLIVEHGLPLSDLSRTPALDIVIDGADEVDEKLQLIKGGGGCQTVKNYYDKLFFILF